MVMYVDAVNMTVACWLEYANVVEDNGKPRECLWMLKILGKARE